MDTHTSKEELYCRYCTHSNKECGICAHSVDGKPQFKRPKSQIVDQSIETTDLEDEEDDN